MRIYYAHCMALYGTPQETRDVKLLAKLFPPALIDNPNRPDITDRCAQTKSAIELANEYRVVKWGGHYRRLEGTHTWINVPRDQATWFTPAELEALKLSPEFVIEHLRPYRDPSQVIMDEIFYPLVASCDVLAFRALPDGAIPAGVAQEIAWADEAKKIVIELPSNLTRRVLTLEQTKSYLREVGQR